MPGYRADPVGLAERPACQICRIDLALNRGVLKGRHVCWIGHTAGCYKLILQNRGQYSLELQFLYQALLQQRCDRTFVLLPGCLLIDLSRIAEPWELIVENRGDSFQKICLLAGLGLELIGLRVTVPVFRWTCIDPGIHFSLVCSGMAYNPFGEKSSHFS